MCTKTFEQLQHKTKLDPGKFMLHICNLHVSKKQESHTIFVIAKFGETE